MEDYLPGVRVYSWDPADPSIVNHWRATDVAEEGPFVFIAERTGRSVLLTIRHKFSGKLVWAQKRHVGDFWPEPEQYWRDWAMSYLERFAKEVKNGIPEDPVELDDWLRPHAALVELLTARVYPGKDKRPRQVATLLIFCEDGQWKTCLGERDTKRSLWGSGNTVEQALECLETLLQREVTPWRHKDGGKKK